MCRYKKLLMPSFPSIQYTINNQCASILYLIKFIGQKSWFTVHKIPGDVAAAPCSNSIQIQLKLFCFCSRVKVSHRIHYGSSSRARPVEMLTKFHGSFTICEANAYLCLLLVVSSHSTLTPKNL